MIEYEILEPRWDGPCIVAATGESLTKKVAEACRGHHVIAVKQAWRLMPWADVLYNFEPYWWEMFQGVPQFGGERWATYDPSIAAGHDPNYPSEKFIALFKKYRLRVVRGDKSAGFSENPARIHYGHNAGFQAINLAIHWLRGPRKRIVLVGFDMSGGYFYGQHPKGPKGGRQFGHFIPEFECAAKELPDGIDIINATPGSLLKCFPMVRLEEALAA